VETNVLKLRLFLEGVEVPCISAVCAAAVGGEATAAIQVVATDAVLDLYPRTLVHLFYYDHDDARGISDLTKDEHDQKEVSGVADLPAYFLEDQYKLLFAGELFSIQYGQTHSSRSAILQCRDFSSYWSSARALFVAGKGTSSKTKALAFSTGGVLRYDKMTKKPYDVVLDILLKKKSIRHPDAQGLMGGILLLLEYLGGVYDGKEQFRGINDFFSQAEMRLHLSRMVGTAVGDDSSKLLLGTSGFKKMLRRSLSAMGNLVSFTDIIDMVLQQLQSYRSPILAPMYRRKVHAAYDVTKTSKTTVPLGDVAADRLALLEWIRIHAEKADQAYDSAQDKDAAGKIVYGQTVSKNPLGDFEQTHIFGKFLARFAGATSENFVSTGPSGYVGVQDASEVEAFPITSELSADIKLGPAAKLDLDAVKFGFNMVAGFFVSERFTGFEFPAINLANLTDFRNRISKAIAAYHKAQVRATTVTESVTGTTAPWLFTEVISPELFLCAPPKCNVLFPEHISQLQTTKEWFKEITRLHLTTRKEWEPAGSSFQKQQYIAPAVTTANETSSLDQFEKGRSFILPHEVYSGIIAKYDQAARIPAYKKLAKNQATEAGDDYQLGKVDYLQRIANFLFIKYRIGPRTMFISGRFNPKAIAGMPMLVVPNLPDDSEVARALLGEEEADLFAVGAGSLLNQERYTQPQVLMDDFGIAMDAWAKNRDKSPKVYCGLLHSLVHNVSQDGAQTKYSISHLWDPYNEEVPGMGNFEVKVPLSSTTKTTVVPKVALNDLILDMEQLTANGATVATYADPGATQQIMEVPGDLDASTTDDKNAVANLLHGDLITAKVDAKGNADKYIGPKGGVVTDVKISDVSAFSVQNSEGDPIGEGTGKVLVTGGTGTVTITETYTEYRRKKLGEIPFEYAVRPPWLGKVFTNTRIGSKFYFPLFGCGSVCDAYKKLSLDLVLNAIDQLKVVEEDKDADSPAAEEQKVVVQTLIQDFVTGHTMKRAADGVLRSYFQNKRLARKGVVGDFIRAFTDRPVATLNDILGSSDLQFDADSGEVVQGREGFHSRAYGNRTDFALLDHPKMLQYNDTGVPKKLDPQTDPRKARSLIVERYVQQLVRLSASATKLKKVD
jgi:hypothetical protein